MSAEILEFKKLKQKPWKSIEPGLVLHVQSGIYYVDKYKAGKGRLNVTTGTTKIGLARTIRDKKISEWLGGKILGRQKTINEICDELEPELQQKFENGQRRKRTSDHDKTYIKIIREHFGVLQVDTINEDYWNAWLEKNRLRLNRNFFDIAKYLSKVLTFAFRKQYINRKPIIGNPDKKPSGIKIYEDEDIMKFIEHAEPTLRDLLIIGAECGLRPHENRELQWSWVKFSDTVSIQLPETFTKTKSSREIQMSPHAGEILKERYKQRLSSPFVFPSPKDEMKPVNDVYLSRMWRRMLKRAGLPPGIKFHWLRHTFYTKTLLDQGMPIQLVSEYGGTSINTLQKRYLKSNAKRTSAVSAAISLNLEKIAEKMLK